MTSRGRLTAGAPLLAAILVFAVAAGVAVRAAIMSAGGELNYALDDAYIHMAVAKNLARHGVWGCTPFHFSSSSSSLLWTLLLGIAFVIVGVRDVVPLVLNLLLGVVTLAVMDRYMRRFGVAALTRGVALIVIIIVSSLPAMVLMGMEHLLHLLVTIWFAGAATEALSLDQHATRASRIGVLCVLAALVATSRYEGLFLVAVVCAAFVLTRRWRHSALIGAAALAPVVSFGLIALGQGGFFLPNSLMLKAVGTSSSGLAALLKPIGIEDAAFYRNNPALLLLLAIALALAAGRAIAVRHVWRPQVLLPAWLAAMILLHGHFVFSSTFWAYRYDAYLLGFGVFAAAVSFAAGTDIHTGTRAVRRVASALVLIAFAVVMSDPRAALSAQAEIRGARNTSLEHVAMADFVRSYYPRDAVVVNDIGAVTYFTEARILDVVGLGDVEPLLISRRTGAYTRDDLYAWTQAYNPRIAIIQLDWSWVAPRVPSQWTRVAEVIIPTHGQRVGLFAVQPSAASLLRANVSYHYGTLHAADGYQVRVF